MQFTPTNYWPYLIYARLSPWMKNDKGNKYPDLDVSVKCWYLGWMDVGHTTEEPVEK